MNRFDLEENIWSTWNTKDDIDLLYEILLKKDLTKDEILKTLLSISTLHNMRCDRLFETFKKLVDTKKIK